MVPGNAYNHVNAWTKKTHNEKDGILKLNVVWSEGLYFCWFKILYYPFNWSVLVWAHACVHMLGGAVEGKVGFKQHCIAFNEWILEFPS